MFVLYKDEMLDVICRKHPLWKGNEDFHNWYMVYVGKTLLGQTALNPNGGWWAICDTNPEHNWAAQGYATRRYAIEFMLRAAGYWNKK